MTNRTLNGDEEDAIAGFLRVKDDLSEDNLPRRIDAAKGTGG